MLLGGALLLRLVLALVTDGYPYDMSCFVAWGEKLLADGPAGFYSGGYFADYPPGYLFVLGFVALVRQIFAIPYEAGMTYVLLAVVPSLCDCAAAALVWHIGREKLPESRLPLLRQTGSLIESPAGYLHLTAQENLEIVADLKGVPHNDIARVLDIVQLTNDQHRKVGQYSLGMKQRLGIAMALLGSPKLLILDEPTNGLDPAGIQEMRSLIAAMPQTTGATVLISSHLLGEIEQMVDQVGILNHGKLLFEGSLQQLQKHSRGGILLRVLDVSKALAVLNEQGMQAAARTEEPDVVLLPPQDDAALAALVCALAERGAGVVGLTSQTKSLEDIFLSLTQTSGEVA